MTPKQTGNDFPSDGGIRSFLFPRNNSLTIREICGRMKFCSSSYLSRQFKEVCGVIPSERREQHVKKAK